MTVTGSVLINVVHISMTRGVMAITVYCHPVYLVKANDWSTIAPTAF
jgi:hypothetical protein